MVELILLSALVPLNQVNAAEIDIAIDGNSIEFTQSSGKPFVDSANRTQVPLRITMEELGAKVDWDPLLKSAIVTIFGQ